MLMGIVLWSVVGLMSTASAPTAIFQYDPIVDVSKENGADDDLGRSLLLAAGTPGSVPLIDINGLKDAVSPPGTAHQVLDPMAGIGQFQEESWCGWNVPATPIPADNPAWEGHDPSTGEVRFLGCPILFPGAPDAPGNPEGRRVVLQFFANAAPIAPPPPDPAILAQEAIRRLTVPHPSIGVGPSREKLAVNLWTWLWIDNPGPLSATVTAGGVSVTATANLSTVTWSLGEPTTVGDTYAPGATATMTCQGTGTPPPPGYDWKAEPPCGYMYHWRSLKERTGGTGKWPIAATSNWNVTWASNTGVTGTTTLNATGNDQFDIEEYRIVLVQPPGG